MRLIRPLAKVIGVGLMAVAFLQWITFDYPDVNPFWPGAVFAPGMLSQFVNWIIVCAIAAIGLLIFRAGGDDSRHNGKDGN